MKMLKYVVFLLVIVNGCKDDDPIPDTNVTIPVYDTAEVGSYFPAYPGSYWVYNTDDSLKVSEDYVRVVTYYGGIHVTSDTFYFPELVLNGIYNSGDSFAYFRDHSISKASYQVENRGSRFKQLLDEKKGVGFEKYRNDSNQIILGFVSMVGASVQIGDTLYKDVIVVDTYNKKWDRLPEECSELREYYCKGVGLIKRETRNYPTESEYTAVLELNSYFINE